MFSALLLITLSVEQVPAPAASLEWLEPLIGVWATEDTTTRSAANLPSNEAPARARSSWAMPRTYRFLINHNRFTSRFQMLSIWSNVPHKLVQSITPDAARTRWLVTNIATVGDNEPMSEHWSELGIDGDRITWTARRVTAGVGPQSAPISFVETWSKQR